MRDPDVRPVSVNTLFDNQTYVVPPYQRGYAWLEGQVTDLLTDLEDYWRSQTGEQEPYVLGQMILARADKADRDRGYEMSLVDGQQRTTTLMLLMAAIRQRVVELHRDFPAESWDDELLTLRGLLTYPKVIGGQRAPRISSPYGGSDQLIEAIVSGVDYGDPQTESSERLVESYQILREWVDSTFPDLSRDDLRRFFHTLLRSVYVVQLTVPNPKDALVIFERINSRGLPLDSADLLRNLLCLNAGETEFARIAALWQSALENLFKIKIKRLSSMVYLLRAIALREGQNVPQNQVFDFWARRLTQSSAAEEAQALARQLKEESGFLRQLSVGSGPTGSPDDLFPAGRHLNVLQHYPILLQAWHLGPGVFEHVALLLDERAALFSLARERTPDFERYVPLIMRELAQLTTSSSRDDVKAAFAAAEDRASRQALLDRGRVAVLGLSYTKGPEVRRQRYVLSRVARYLDTIGGQHVVPYSDLLAKPKRNQGFQLDHIYPQAGITGPENLHSIGNLALIESSVNAGLGDVLPGDKTKIDAYKSSQLLITKILGGDKPGGLPKKGDVVRDVRATLGKHLKALGVSDADPEVFMVSMGDAQVAALSETYWEYFVRSLDYSKLP